MVDFERNLKQTCTYWARTGHDIYGKATFATKVELPCRWEDTAELFIDKGGQEAVSKSKVFLAQDIDLHGYLLQGTTAETDPLAIPDAYEVRHVKRTPDLRAIKTLYVAFL